MPPASAKTKTSTTASSSTNASATKTSSTTASSSTNASVVAPVLSSSSFPRPAEFLDFLFYLPSDAQLATAQALDYSEEVGDAELLDEASAMHTQLDTLRFMNNDLQKLLSLPFSQFWSHVLHDNSLFRFLDSYLWYARKRHQAEGDEKEKKVPQLSEEQQRLSEDFKQLQTQIRRRVFMTFVRMTKLSESEMKLEEFGKLAYDNWLFSIPGLLDFCVLFGKCQLAEPVVATVLSSHRGFEDSLVQTLQAIQKTLQDIQAAVQKQLTRGELQKVGNLLVDTVVALDALLKLYPPASTQYQKVDLIESLVVVYEITIPLFLNSAGDLPALQPRLAQVGRACVRTVGRIVNECFIKPLTAEKKTEEKKGDLETVAQEFADFLVGFAEIAIAVGQRVDPSVSGCLQLGSCFTAYCRKGKLGNVIQALPKSTLQLLGESRVDYLLDLIRARGVLVRSATKSLGPSMKGDPPNVAALITSLTSIFSDITEEFALDCLRHYNFQTEIAINNILSGSLPTFLADKQFSEATLGLKFLHDSGLGQPAIRRTASQNSGILDDDSTEDLTFQAYLTRTGRVARDKDLGALGVTSDLWAPPVSSKEQIRNTLRGFEYEDEYDDQYEEFTSFAALDSKNPEHRKIAEDLDAQEATRNFNIGPLFRNPNRSYQDEEETKVVPQPVETVSWPPPKQAPREGNNTQPGRAAPFSRGGGRGGGGKHEEKSKGKGGEGRGVPLNRGGNAPNDSDDDGPRNGPRKPPVSRPASRPQPGGRGGGGKRQSDDDDDGPRGQYQPAPRFNNTRSDSDDEQSSRKGGRGGGAGGRENGSAKRFGRGASSAGRGSDLRSDEPERVQANDARDGRRDADGPVKAQSNVVSARPNVKGQSASDNKPSDTRTNSRGDGGGSNMRGRGGGASRGRNAPSQGTTDGKDESESSSGEEEPQKSGNSGAPVATAASKQKYKDKNKARIGNHNRKAGAAKKMAGRGGFGGAFGSSATTD